MNSGFRNIYLAAFCRYSPWFLRIIVKYSTNKIKILVPYPCIKQYQIQGAKKVIFTACQSGKLKLAFTSPNIISTSPQNFLMSSIILILLISHFFCKLNSSKYFTCPSDKLRTESTSPIAKSTSPGLSDTTFFARWPEYTFPIFKHVKEGRKKKFFFPFFLYKKYFTNRALGVKVSS